VAIESVDFRKGIDGLARVCKEELKSDPFSGCLFECPRDCTRFGKEPS
jgi:transposase